MALSVAKRPRGRLSMTSLIDVIFLLLLFFMLSSTFTKYGEIELLGAAPGASADGEIPEILFLSLGAERVLLNGQPLEASDLAERLAQNEDDKPRTVLINLDDDVTSQRLMDMLAILRAITGLRTSVLG